MLDKRGKALVRRSQKIVLIVPEFPKISETFIVRKFTGLIKKGLDIHIVCQKSEESELRHFPELLRGRDCRKRIHVSPPMNNKVVSALMFPLIMISLMLSAPIRTLRYLVAGFSAFGFRVFGNIYQDSPLIFLKPAIIHFEFGSLAVGKTQLKEILKSKLAVSFRGYDLNFSGLENPDYYKKVWNDTDTIHCLGKNLWQLALQRGCPADKRHVFIPPSIDTSFFNPESVLLKPHKVIGGQERPVRILSIGRLEWKKGYEFSLKALKILKDEGVYIDCRIIGAGEYLEAIAYCRHQLNLGKEVELFGALSQTETLEHLKWADIFIHSAVTEGFCNAVLEAQAMGIPVISSDAGGLPENIEDGVTGYVVRRRDEAAMAAKILSLIKNPEARENMGRKGRERVLKHFRMEDQIQAFENFYSDILES